MEFNARSDASNQLGQKGFLFFSKLICKKIKFYRIYLINKSIINENILKILSKNLSKIALNAFPSYMRFGE